MSIPRCHSVLSPNTADEEVTEEMSEGEIRENFRREFVWESLMIRFVLSQETALSLTQ